MHRPGIILHPAVGGNYGDVFCPLSQGVQVGCNRVIGGLTKPDKNGCNRVIPARSRLVCRSSIKKYSRRVVVKTAVNLQHPD